MLLSASEAMDAFRPVKPFSNGCLNFVLLRAIV